LARYSEIWVPQAADPVGLRLEIANVGWLDSFFGLLVLHQRIDRLAHLGLPVVVFPKLPLLTFLGMERQVSPRKHLAVSLEGGER